MKTNSRKSLITRLAAAAASLVLVVALAAGGICIGSSGGDNPLAQTAYASDNTYTTNIFATDFVVNEDNSFNITENIRVDFKYPHHGIYRYIPINGVKFKHLRIPGYDYESYYENGYYVLKIGSGDRTLTGVNDYSIKYDMLAWDDETTEKDVLMLNVIPTGWTTDIDYAKSVIHLPKAVDKDAFKLYSGSYGTEGNEAGANIQVSEDGKTVTVTARNLWAGEGVTLIADLPEGYFANERVRGTITPFMVILLLLGPVLCFLLWFRFGRDSHVVKTIEFYPPDGLTPGEIGYLIDGSVDKCDLVSSIVYMANQGYLKIEELEKQVGKISRKANFRLVKQHEISAGEPDYMKKLFAGLFTGRDSVTTDKLGTKFGRKFEQAKESLENMYSISNVSSWISRAAAMILSALPFIAMGTWYNHSGFDEGFFVMIGGPMVLWVGEVLLILAVDGLRRRTRIRTGIRIAFGLLFSELSLELAFDSYLLTGVVDEKTRYTVKLAMTAAVVLCVLFTLLMLKKSPERERLMGRILGFRDFIATAELDKLNELIEEDPEYFYSISPYAYVLGLSNRWIKKFEDIPMEGPKWIVGPGGMRYDHYDAYMMGHMMHNCSTSVSHHIQLPKTSGGSSHHSGGGSSFSGGGFSGGGFSGGGMGGGGGGAW